MASSLVVAPGSAPAVISHVARQAAGSHIPGPHTSATWASSNWSGYAETGTFPAISGSWTVPTASAGATTTSGFGRHGSTTSAWYSATWLGVDGFNNSNLIQTGTEQDFYGGSAHYSAWWEILPAAETVIAKPVLPGDTLTATIRETSTVVTVGGGRRGRGTTEHEWTITLQDPTQNWSFTTTQPYAGMGTSAEWVVEAPEVNGTIAPLARYAFPAGSSAPGDFNGAEVASTLGGPLTGAGLSYSADAGVMVQSNAQVSTPGPQDASGVAFNALYGATAPPVPMT